MSAQIGRRAPQVFLIFVNLALVWVGSDRNPIRTDPIEKTRTVRSPIRGDRLQLPPEIAEVHVASDQVILVLAELILGQAEDD